MSLTAAWRYAMQELIKCTIMRMQNLRGIYSHVYSHHMRVRVLISSHYHTWHVSDRLVDWLQRVEFVFFCPVKNALFTAKNALFTAL